MPGLECRTVRASASRALAEKTETAPTESACLREPPALVGFAYSTTRNRLNAGGYGLHADPAMETASIAIPKWPPALFSWLGFRRDFRYNLGVLSRLRLGSDFRYNLGVFSRLRFRSHFSDYLRIGSWLGFRRDFGYHLRLDLGLDLGCHL